MKRIANNSSIPLRTTGGLLAASVLAVAAFWCICLDKHISGRLFPPAVFLVYAYPLCASVFAARKGLKAGIIAGAAAGVGEYLLFTTGCFLSAVIRGDYDFAFIADIMPMFMLLRLPHYLTVVPAVVAFYMLFSVLKRKTFFCAGRWRQYLGSALLSLATLAVYDIILICMSGVSLLFLFIPAFATVTAGTVLFSCFAKFTSKIKEIPTDET